MRTIAICGLFGTDLRQIIQEFVTRHDISGTAIIREQSFTDSTGTQVNTSALLEAITTESTKPCVTCLFVIGSFLYETRPLRAQFPTKLFFEQDAETALCEQLRNQEDSMSILATYEAHHKPAIDDRIQPSKKFADLLVQNKAALFSLLLSILHSNQPSTENATAPTTRHRS